MSSEIKVLKKKGFYPEWNGWDYRVTGNATSKDLLFKESDLKEALLALEQKDRLKNFLIREKTILRNTMRFKKGKAICYNETAQNAKLQFISKLEKDIYTKELV